MLVPHNKIADLYKVIHGKQLSNLCIPDQPNQTDLTAGDRVVAAVTNELATGAQINSSLY